MSNQFNNNSYKSSSSFFINLPNCDHNNDHEHHHHNHHHDLNHNDDHNHHHDHHHHDNHQHQDISSTISTSCSRSSSTENNHQHHHHHHHINHVHYGGDDDDGEQHHQSIDSLHGLRFLSMIWIIVIHSYNFALRWSFFSNTSNLNDLYKTSASQLIANGTFACDSFLFVGGFLLPYLTFPDFSSLPSSTLKTSSSSSSSSSEVLRKEDDNDNDNSQFNETTIELENRRRRAEKKLTKKTILLIHKNEFTIKKIFENLLHRYIRMMPLMMAIIALSSTLLRYLGSGQQWDNSTIMFDKWCRDNWWINLLFLHNFLNRENMCLSHSWYSAVDIQLFFLGQLIIFILFRNKKIGLILIIILIFLAQFLTALLTIIHNLPAVPLISNFSEQSTNLYYGEIYIKPYCRASPYLIGILLAYLMRTTSLGKIRLSKFQAAIGWAISLGTLYTILMAMQPAMNGQPLSKLQSALYSSLSRPLWACATGWMIFACMTKNGFFFQTILGAKAFIPLSRLTYPAFLIHPIVMVISYGGGQNTFQFSHYLMLYLILGNIVITYLIAFLLSILFELPFLTAERKLKRAWLSASSSSSLSSSSSAASTTSNTTTTTVPTIRLSTPSC